MGTPSQSYGTSLAIWDHAVLPATRHKWTRPANPSHAGWYSIYLPRRDGRLSWPSWLDNTPAWSWTSDLLITSPTPKHCTTKTTRNWSHIGDIANILVAVLPGAALFKNLRLRPLTSDRNEIWQDCSSIDGVGFLRWYHSFKMAVMTSAGCPLPCRARVSSCSTVSDL